MCIDPSVKLMELGFEEVRMEPNGILALAPENIQEIDQILSLPHMVRDALPWEQKAKVELQARKSCRWLVRFFPTKAP